MYKINKKKKKSIKKVIAKQWAKVKWVENIQYKKKHVQWTQLLLLK